jgi:brefeldin A-inhibited guanine nucleotide-exchange protein
MRDYNKLRPDTNVKSITAWSPVIGTFLQGVCGFDDSTFNRFLPALYPLVVELLARDMSPELRDAAKMFFTKNGQVQGFLET